VLHDLPARFTALFTDAPFELRLLVQFLLIAPGVLVVSALYLRLIERPSMQPNWPPAVIARIGDWRDLALRRAR
jgi:hypothetical protein